MFGFTFENFQWIIHFVVLLQAVFNLSELYFWKNRMFYINLKKQQPDFSFLCTQETVHAERQLLLHMYCSIFGQDMLMLFYFVYNELMLISINIFLVELSAPVDTSYKPFYCTKNSILFVWVCTVACWVKLNRNRLHQILNVLHITI